MVLPVAHIGHHTAERIRIKIPSRKGETVYFSAARDMLLKHVPMDSLEVNPVTGSMLLKGANIDVGAIASAGEANALFKLETEASPIQPLSRQITAPFRDLSRSIDRFSGGELDLPGMAVLALLVAGIYQVARGNLTGLPWHVAFWYALGILTQSFMFKK